VFLTTWHEFPDLAADAIDWPALIQLRSEIARELERLRVAGEIGAPLDAEVDVYALPAEHARLAVLNDELRYLLITSAARVQRVTTPPEGAVPVEGLAADSVWIRVRPASAPKCVRCWHHREDVGSEPAHPPLCGRCAGNLSGAGETRIWA
jgi:isoleucyl-tRNA synthetase